MKTCRTAAPSESELTPRAGVVVGVGGPSGSGKTTLAKALAEKFRELGVCLMDQDSYYLDRSHLSVKERAALNYDEPYAIDHNLLRTHLESLTIGQAVQKPVYDFATHTRAPRRRMVRAQPLIILEGIYCFWDSRARALMDLKVYVDAEADVRFIRRLQRDVRERSRSVESVISQYADTVRPMQKRFIEPFKDLSDLVIDTTQSFPRAKEELIRAVAERLNLRAGRIRTLVA
jgi:uridine kinase